ncbi:beta-xylosidase-like protein [Tieghemostelium lacteum]|uniref:Beta-xylosidase-like protein n=1 Tax=Tieghemostelium lacteum TaxID=361077 RepID=A0A151ZSI2_TIELA|nr:beta-xylosidase-like protein [Tieghemostelium lacteum]|eukprot:KYQ96902.1 beta-xylosidase-like protein [Tieghemostelium lacteum]
MNKNILSIFVVLILIQLCFASVSVNTCDSTSLIYTADLKNTTEWEHYWEGCVGSGHAWLGTRQDWRDALKTAVDKLGFERIRFHGIFDDDMNVYQEAADGTPIYSYYNVDQVYDYILSLGVRPIVELSFMPTAMASGNTTIFHYRGNITPPKNYTLWADMIENFLQHLIDRYTMDEVKKWHFEVWNEPNCGFWTGNMTEYYHLLQVTFNAIKSVSTEFSVGGPATCQSQYLAETLQFTQENNFTLDFVSTHEYPTDIQPVQRNIMYQVLSNSRAIVGPDMPLFYTEYNDGLYSPGLHDTTFASAFAIFNIIDVYGIADIFSWWTFSDVFEEQGQQSVPFNQGFGLQTIYGIPKPSFKAFELLHETGYERAYVDGPDHPTAGVLVTKGDSEIMVIVYNHNIPGAPITNETVCITINNVPANVNSATLRRIDDENCNPIAIWTQMGSPTYPSQDQIDEIYDSAQFVYEDIDYKYLSLNTLSFEIIIPPQGVAAIKLEY